ncbi:MULTISPECIES: HlyD family secretion protein [unclassified Novosphingobium]|uniref:HlyD family secretion protein n=1 Tax=unclassified Novosphingobium TaxID=2644732 RepID=UPI0014465340|nr:MULTISPECIES: HlyD family secretion protein [unclassified Novosphingobium]NKJ41744.1 membrane fusion protein (multidrug efflux system) [Novosphingobium sp. SG720]NMN04130.1 membrane fusion protein (multidrug efflux system) [Novosphingobium sp. SG919]NMN85880.1 membrane fusion protein (multidrug efflux system) [Novosphingobium sp. SG916]
MPASDTPAETSAAQPAAEETPAPSGRKKLIGRIAIGVAAVGLVYGIYAFIDYRNNGQYVQSTDDAYVKADGVTVSSKLAGYVRQIGVADNQQVNAGAFLVQIDPTDYSTKLNQAQAQVDVARAAQQATAAGIAEAQASLNQARAALAASQRDLAYYSGEAARYAPLAASGAEPRTQLDQLTSARDKAAADVRAKQAMVEAATAKIATIKAQVQQADAQITSAQATQAAARNDVGTTRIVAPIAGKVGSSAVRLGQYVQPGQRLLTIVPTQAIYVEANFKETQIGLMRPGQPVTMHVDALPDVDFHGVVESITPGTGANFSLIPPQNATGNFTKIVQRVPVRIRINAGEESRKVLVPGLSLTVKVDTKAAKGAIKAIRAEQDQGAK